MQPPVHPLVVELVSRIGEFKDLSQLEVEGMLGIRNEQHLIQSTVPPSYMGGSIPSRGFLGTVPADLFTSQLNRFNTQHVPGIGYIDSFYKNSVRIRKRNETATTNRTGKSALYALPSGPTVPMQIDSGQPPQLTVVEVIQKIPYYELPLSGIQTKSDARLTLKMEVPLTRDSPLYPADTELPYMKRTKQTWTFPFPTPTLKHFQVVFDIVTTSSGTQDYRIEVEVIKTSLSTLVSLPAREFAEQWMTALLVVAGQENILFDMAREVPMPSNMAATWAPSAAPGAAATEMSIVRESDGEHKNPKSLVHPGPVPNPIVQAAPIRKPVHVFQTWFVPTSRFLIVHRKPQG